MSEEIKTISVRVPESMYDRLKAIADAEERGVSNMVFVMLKGLLANKAKA